MAKVCVSDHIHVQNIRQATNSYLAVMIFHVTTRQEWETQLSRPEFLPRDYQREGFIHCCTREQVDGVLERYFAGQKDLVLVHLDELLLTSALKYEPSTNKELFPHLYGPINRNAVVAVTAV